LETALIDTSLPPQAYARAYELVGQFLYHFSRLEEQLNIAVGQLFKLEEPATQIVTSNLDFSRKVSIVRSAVNEQNSSPDLEWLRTEIKDTFGAILAMNDQRLVVAHSAFEPGQTGGVQFRRATARNELRRVDPYWDEAKFAQDYETMKTLVQKLVMVPRHIEPYVPKLDFSDPRNSGYIALLT